MSRQKKASWLRSASILRVLSGRITLPQGVEAFAAVVGFRTASLEALASVQAAATAPCLLGFLRVAPSFFGRLPF